MSVDTHPEQLMRMKVPDLIGEAAEGLQVQFVSLSSNEASSKFDVFLSGGSPRCFSVVAQESGL